MDFPFEQEFIEGKLKRSFATNVDSEELKWHQDLKDRKVKILESGGWEFQMENSLPIKLFNNQEIFIPKLNWHRVIKGKTKLVVEIEEFES